MCSKRDLILLAATILQLCWLSPAFPDDTDWMKVVPKESIELLANPGMGWQTFHRTSAADKNLPEWIPSTVHYARWGWGQLEPKRGEIDYRFLDGVLKETRESGQTLAFRVMCCSSSPRQPYHPNWLPDIGGDVVMTRYGNGPELEVPVLDDPEVLAAHLDLIKRLGARYDGHPDIDHVDLGTVGWWGEWHMSQSTNAPMPTPLTVWPPSLQSAAVGRATGRSDSRTCPSGCFTAHRTKRCRCGDPKKWSSL